MSGRDRFSRSNGARTSEVTATPSGATASRTFESTTTAASVRHVPIAGSIVSTDPSAVRGQSLRPVVAWKSARSASLNVYRSKISSVMLIASGW